MPGRELKFADCYHWEHPGGAARIYLRAGVADRLQSVVSQATGSRAAEVGGILLGRIAAGAIVIEDYVSVPCSHPRGLYELSPAETETFEAALLQAAMAASDLNGAPPVIGYFRSHSRDGLSLSSHDLALIESYFQAPESVFLLVKTVRESPACTAGFFFWENGRVHAEFSSLEVALGGNTSPLPAALAPEPLEFRQPALAPSTRAHSPWRDLLLRAAMLSFASVTIVLSVLTYLGTSRTVHESAAARVNPSVTLGLQVQRNPLGVWVTWNRQAAAVVAAQRGTLSIRDGSLFKVVDLDIRQLTTGSVFYAPAGDDIQFQLDVYGADEKGVSQSVRLLLPHPERRSNR